MLWPNFSQFTTLTVLTTLVDIAIVAFLLYKIVMLLKGTRAVQLIRGIVFLLIAVNISDLLGFSTIQWILDQAWSVIFVALAVVFQPELRRALEQVGRGQFFTKSRTDLGTGDIVHLIDELVAALVSCSKTKTGALIILEQETGLSDYIETGVVVDAVISQEMLMNTFSPNTPLHDGAAIVRGDRLVAAACFLPLTDNPYISTSLGTRHRAAIGVSEVSDAVALVVSEETGTISMARDGKLVRSLDERQLRDSLTDIYSDVPNSSKFLSYWRGIKK